MASFQLKMIEEKNFLINKTASKVLYQLKLADRETREDPSRYIITAINRISFLAGKSVFLESEVIEAVCRIIGLLFDNRYSGFTADMEFLNQSTGMRFVPLQDPNDSPICSIRVPADGSFTIMTNTLVSVVFRVPVERGSLIATFNTTEFYTLDISISDHYVIQSDGVNIQIITNVNIQAGIIFSISMDIPMKNYFFYGNISTINLGITIYNGIARVKINDDVVSLREKLFSSDAFRELKRTDITGIFMGLSKSFISLSAISQSLRLDCL